MHWVGRTSLLVQPNEEEAAERFADLFPQIYLRLHARKDRDATRVTPQMWGVLQHLAMAGPLTVTEAAAHFNRAQSVVSETVDALCEKNLLERMQDARDRRRTLVWLTEDGQKFLARERRVLDDNRLLLAMKALTKEERRELIQGMEALVRACESIAFTTTTTTSPSSSSKKGKRQ